MSLHGEPQIFHVVKGEKEVDAVIAQFDVKRGSQDKVHVITGNMHFACDKKSPTILQRKKAVNTLLRHLESPAAPEPHTPVVRIIVGDNNLNSHQVREALQRVTDAEPVCGRSDCCRRL